MGTNDVREVRYCNNELCSVTKTPACCRTCDHLATCEFKCVFDWDANCKFQVKEVPKVK